MTEKMKRVWQRRRWVVVASVVLVAGLATFGFVTRGSGAPAVPTAEVRKGEFVDYLQIRGEVKAQKSVIVAAPSSAGDLQIIKLAKNGSVVQPGEVLVEFDTTQLKRTLDEKQSELKRSEAEINRTRAQGRLKSEETLTESMSADYNVQRARLDVSKQEVVSEIEAEKSKLTLANNQQKVEEVAQKLKSAEIETDADVQSRRQKREKALYEVRQAEQRIASMTLKAPVGGMVTLLPNFRARGFFGGGSVPEFKEGDRAWPGAGIAELPELNSIQVKARVDETDRGRLKNGLEASIRVDAIPDKEFKGKLVDISALAKLDFSGWPITKNFDIAMQLDQADDRLRPGMSATARVAVERIPDSIIIPSEALFTKAGRNVVYVMKGRRFEEREVQIGRRGKGELMVLKGLQQGERVATKDPTEEQAQ